MSNVVALDAVTLDEAAATIGHLAGQISDIAKDAQPTTCLAGISGHTTSLIASGAGKLMNIADALPLQCVALTTAAMKMIEVGGVAAANDFLNATPLASPYPQKPAHKKGPGHWYSPASILDGLGAAATELSKGIDSAGGAIGSATAKQWRKLTMSENAQDIDDELTSRPPDIVREVTNVYDSNIGDLGPTWRENHGKAVGLAIGRILSMSADVGEVGAGSRAAEAAGKITDSSKVGRAAAKTMEVAGDAIDVRTYPSHALNTAKKIYDSRAAAKQSALQDDLAAATKTRGNARATAGQVAGIKQTMANVAADQARVDGAIDQANSLLDKINNPRIRLAEDATAQAGNAHHAGQEKGDR